MSRNQQIIILVIAVVFSVALVIGAYLKKHPEAFKGDSQQQAQQQGTQQGDQPPVRPPVENVLDNNKNITAEARKNLQEYQDYQKKLQAAEDDLQQKC